MLHRPLYFQYQCNKALPNLQHSWGQCFGHFGVFCKLHSFLKHGCSTWDSHSTNMVVQVKNQVDLQQYAFRYIDILQPISGWTTDLWLGNRSVVGKLISGWATGQWLGNRSVIGQPISGWATDQWLGNRSVVGQPISGWETG